MLWVEISHLNEMQVRAGIREAQGRRREVGSEGVVDQTCDLMNKNRIRGLSDGASTPVIAKSAPSIRRGGRFGRYARALFHSKLKYSGEYNRLVPQLSP